jgi:aromatic ring-opening dioxygenase catalytic subunit (LigB family)
MPRQIGTTPKAVLMVSGHWEEDDFAVMSSPKPPMVYDYYGFPPHTYQVVYGAAGAPELAARVQGLITAAGLPAQLDPARGFDHGAFVPMAVMYPDADMPLVQLSLREGLDAEEHLVLGRALSPLRDEGVLIVGSGLSYHNLRAFRRAGRDASIAFDAWLQESVVQRRGEDRSARLREWETAPAARAAHPREEHLLPLMVAVGAAEADEGACCYHEDTSHGIVVSSFRFGGP